MDDAAATVYADLLRRGLSFTVDDGRLYVRPAGLVTDEVAAAIRAHRDDLAVLASLGATPIPTCRICRNNRGAHVDDDQLCAVCRSYTRRFGDPQDKASPQ